MTARRWIRIPQVAARAGAVAHGCTLVAIIVAVSSVGLVAPTTPAGADAPAYFFSSDEVGTTGTTPTFSVSAPWTIGWRYACTDYAQGGSFSVMVDQPAGDHTVDPGFNESGAGTDGTINYADSGTFSVTVTSGCYWELEIYPTGQTPVVLGPPSFKTGPVTPDPTRVGIAADPGGRGIWTARADGSVDGFLGGIVMGDPARLGLNSPIVSIAAARGGYGYYLLGADGGIFNYGPNFYGSTGGMRLNHPVEGMAVSPDGRGYWLVASDGGVFAFGDAPFLGSTGSMQLNRPVVGMVAYGGGYTLVASDGGIFNFGTTFLGSLGSLHLNAPIVGMVATPDGGGYWLVASDGGVFNFGDAGFFGSGVGSGKSFAGISATPDGSGYWIVATDGTILNFGAAAGAPAAS